MQSQSNRKSKDKFTLVSNRYRSLLRWQPRGFSTFKLSFCVVLQSAAQQAEEDAAIAGQVRGEMWGNLQGILSMLAGQGCSPHVQDMLHQIAVHFANEQSQSVALERRLTGNIAKEKEAQKRTQKQLQGGIQVSFGGDRYVFVVQALSRLVLHVPSSL